MRNIFGSAALIIPTGHPSSKKGAQQSMDIPDIHFPDFNIHNTHTTFTDHLANPLDTHNPLEPPFQYGPWEDPVDHFAYTNSNTHPAYPSGAVSSAGTAPSTKPLNVNPNNFKPSTTASEAAPMPGFFKRIGNTISNLYESTLEVVQNLVERMIRGFNRLFGKATVESVAESAVKTAAKVI
jgi:hypothetical protein